MMVCLYYGKQESRSTKKESENEFNQTSIITKNCIDSMHMYSCLVILMPK